MTADLKDGLKVGLVHEFEFVVPENKTVPNLYPEVEDFQVMPEVFATGFMVGFLEWVALLAIKPYLDWPTEQSLGTHINVSHIAATVPGMTVTGRAELIEIDGRRLVFKVSAHDGIDTISEGTHERHLIDKARFESKLARKIDENKT